MPRIRILVVDDSVVIRRALCDTLSKDPDLEVIASAGDGLHAGMDGYISKPIRFSDIEKTLSGFSSTQSNFATSLSRKHNA